MFSLFKKLPFPKDLRVFSRHQGFIMQGCSTGATAAEKPYEILALLKKSLVLYLIMKAKEQGSFSPSPSVFEASLLFVFRGFSLKFFFLLRVFFSSRFKKRFVCLSATVCGRPPPIFITETICGLPLPPPHCVITVIVVRVIANEWPC